MYVQLTSEQRYQIFALLQTKTPRKVIAEIIGKSESTISRELRRNRTAKGNYLPWEAHAKVSVRNARREMIEGLKKAVKDGMPEDSQKDGEEKVQKLHDKFLKKIDKVFAAKEKEILTV